jgi:hypothetical protein
MKPESEILLQRVARRLDVHQSEQFYHPVYLKITYLHLHPVPTIHLQQGSDSHGLLFLFEHPQFDVVGQFVGVDPPVVLPGSSQAMPSLS